MKDIDKFIKYSGVDIEEYKKSSIYLHDVFENFKFDKKYNDKLILKRYDKFIKQDKEFIDDVWFVIKTFMIEPRYKKSYKLRLNKEIRFYYYSYRFKTIFVIGNRFKNLIQVKQTHYEDGTKVYKPYFKLYKIKTEGSENKNGDCYLTEYVDILTEHYDAGDCIDGIWYIIRGDKTINKIVRYKCFEDYDDY